MSGKGAAGGETERASAATLDGTTRAFRAAQRSPANLAFYCAIAALICALPLVPGMRAVLGLEVGQLARWVVACLSATALATTLYYRLGERSTLYRIVALGEGILLQAGLAGMVVLSGRGANVLWLTYVAYATLNAGITEARRVLGALVVAPPLVAAALFLAVRRDPAGAIGCVLAGAISALVFLTSSRAHLQREATHAALARAEAQLSELRLREERQRIARDLHDGPAADLAAIAWKAQALRAELAEAGDHRAALDGLVTRATEGIDELRSVVWSLRKPSQPWGDLVAYLRQRCRELCEGRVELTVRADGDLEDDDEAAAIAAREVPGPLAMEILRVTQEAVRNAVRHAAARRIVVDLAQGPPHVVTVEDDGRGISAEALARARGGLANFRARAEACGGEASVEPREPGTRVRVVLARAPIEG